MNFDAGPGKPFRHGGQLGRARAARVAADHLLTQRPQGQGSRLPGPGQPDDQIWTRWQRRPWLGHAQPRMLSRYTVKAIAAQATATIQNRRMILVSDQAWSSKWW
jgi:hypothetical protein